MDDAKSRMKQWLRALFEMEHGCPGGDCSMCPYYVEESEDELCDMMCGSDCVDSLREDAMKVLSEDDE